MKNYIINSLPFLNKIRSQPFLTFLLSSQSVVKNICFAKIIWNFSFRLLLLLPILFYISHLYLNNFFFLIRAVSFTDIMNSGLDLLLSFPFWSLSLFLLWHVFSLPEVLLRFSFAYLVHFIRDFSPKFI